MNRVAVIGALATDARVLGGGRAQVSPPAHTISPLEGLAREHVRGGRAASVGRPEPVHEDNATARTG